MGQYLSRWLTLSVLPALALFVFAQGTQATDLSGTYSTPQTITDDSRLTGDVTCLVPAGQPCITIGVSHIKLRLNGFTITGSPTDCKAPTASTYGIVVAGQHDVVILGPGLVQKFAVFGIALSGASKVTIEEVTASDNCFSGIFLSGTTDSDIERNVSVRNSLASHGNPCGGT
jgi:parallel beta-helix repeat protein